MLPVKNKLTLIFLILLIVIAILTKIRSVFLACLSIVLCVLYLFHGWIQNANQRKTSSEKAPNSDNECIIGKTKQIGGIFANGCFDIWHVYHLFFWILIGLLAPNHIILIGFVSASWEVIEHIFSSLKKYCLVSKTNAPELFVDASKTS